MTVEILPLSGLPAAGARQAADALLDLDTGPDRLERLLVLDDTALLEEHESVYEHIDTAKRVEKLLCVTVGPRTGDGRKLELPGNLGGSPGLAGAVGEPSGRHQLAGGQGRGGQPPPGHHPGRRWTSTLWSGCCPWTRCSTEFTRPSSTMCHTGWPAPDCGSRGPTTRPRPSRAPSPWPSGASANLARTSEEPFGELLPARSGGASLGETGPLARYLGRIAEMDREASRALEKAGGLGGMLKRGESGVQRYVIMVGEALTDLRDLVGPGATGRQRRRHRRRADRQPAGPGA